uniref:NADH-ubiquinone oxidoreductase chain 3 n=1 Tax=Physemacris variolosa TaxID=62778 RepID=E0YCJ3_9ORTH|nr:NADH dehydrogenase subunit 3 [Physemacris variolosa]ADD97028.1 NADH dehydrogenase subunit 3 [Physemacris variolosa]
MLMMVPSFLISIIIPTVIIMISTNLSKKMIHDREKSSPFECGFDPKSPSRMPFSLQFFMIAVVFLVFDVEIAMILPTLIIMKSSNLTIWLMSSSIFIFILLSGLYHEWNQGALKWAA